MGVCLNYTELMEMPRMAAMCQCVACLPSLTTLCLEIGDWEPDHDSTVIASVLHDLKYANLSELNFCIPHEPGTFLVHPKAVFNEADVLGSEMDNGAEWHVVRLSNKKK